MLGIYFSGTGNSTNNIVLTNKLAACGNQCTMCYRCVNNCPKQALTLLGKRVYEQCYIEKYLR